MTLAPAQLYCNTVPGPEEPGLYVHEVHHNEAGHGGGVTLQLSSERQCWAKGAGLGHSELVSLNAQPVCLKTLHEGTAL